MCIYIHACIPMCTDLHTFRFTPLIHEGIDIPCQPWPTYFWCTINVLENKVFLIKKKPKRNKKLVELAEYPQTQPTAYKETSTCCNLTHHLV